MFTRELGWSVRFVAVLFFLPTLLLALSLFHPAVVAEAQAHTPVVTADRDEAHECSLATLKGTYGVLDQGTFVGQFPGFPPPPYPVAISGVLTYDGAGNFSGHTRGALAVPSCRGR